MNCSRCGRELTEKESYVYQGKIMCEDCLMDMGLSLRECDPWATYVDTSARKRRGLRGADEMTEMEKKVYEFVKSRGKATREEIMKSLSLSEIDLKSHLLPLMHSELLKEHSEGDKMYVIPIG